MEDSEDAAVVEYNAAWEWLRTATRGADVLEVERLIREWADARGVRLTEIDVALMARVMSDERWACKHPLSALALAWKHRRLRPPFRTLMRLFKPRFAASGSP